MSIRILHGDCRDVLVRLPDASVHCVVTSPPYWGLRDYGTATWEGGSSSCDHIVGEIRTGLGLAALGEQYKGGGKKQSEPKPLFAKSECPRCGAVRVDQQIGMEDTPEEYVAQMVEVFREVRRVLRDDGTLWLNLGDAYSSRPNGSIGKESRLEGAYTSHTEFRRAHALRSNGVPDGLKHKDLIGLPWMVAFALRVDGWWLRKDNIWAKKNCMPESVTDRTTTAHEYVFQLTKSGAATYWTHRDKAGFRVQPDPDYRWVNKETKEEIAVPPAGWPDQGKDVWRRINLWRGHDYFYDAVAIEEEGDIPAGTRAAKGSAARGDVKNVNGRPPEYYEYTGKRNKRSVWHVATQPFAEAHFATMPPAIVETCILAGTSERGCCSACGAPWTRQVDHSLIPGPKAVRNAVIDDRDHAADANDQGSNRQKDGHKPGYQSVNRTRAWAPSCACDAGKPVPCTVLDPFGGAGTTGLVADRLGRDAILIELNADYAEMAKRRVTRDAGMFAEIT